MGRAGDSVAKTPGRSRIGGDPSSAPSGIGFWDLGSCSRIRLPCRSACHRIEVTLAT